MSTIMELIHKYHNGEEEATEQIIERMTPLIKKYAGKIHCMEYEDALQEFFLALLECLKYLDSSSSEGKCVKYMETVIINRYYTLCKRFLSIPEFETIENHAASQPIAPSYDDSQMDVEAYIHALPVDGFKRQVFTYFFYEDLSDKEIAEKLNISRQYVNRVKKEMIRDYFSKQEKSLL